MDMPVYYYSGEFSYCDDDGENCVDVVEEDSDALVGIWI